MGPHFSLGSSFCDLPAFSENVMIRSLPPLQNAIRGMLSDGVVDTHGLFVFDRIAVSELATLFKLQDVLRRQSWAIKIPLPHDDKDSQRIIQERKCMTMLACAPAIESIGGAAGDYIVMGPTRSRTEWMNCICRIFFRNDSPRRDTVELILFRSVFGQLAQLARAPH